MSYEVDYLPVGDGEKSGDAIALRFGNLAGSRDEQILIVIDGGFKESGEQLVNHIKQYYQTDRIDVVISTHPDADHASGLLVILEKLKVDNLLMHRPWEHAENIKGFFRDKRLTVSGLAEKIEKSLQHASDLEDLATQKGIKIIEPFQGTHGFNGAMHILGPSEDYYRGLLTQFKTTPEPVKVLDFLAPVQKMAQDAIRWVNDALHLDLLDDDEDSTSAENNTSAIVLFNIDGHKLLFTGDAGKTGLIQAVDYAESIGHTLTDLNFFDIPHHGSKRNLSSKILKRINTTTSFISASKESPKHPAKKITNALQKHGSKVFVTRGSLLCHYFQAPNRNWSPAQAEPFHDRVEE